MDDQSMKQVQQDFGSGELRLAEVPTPSVKPEGILVRTAHSSVSAGTESSLINLAKKSLVGKARERPDLVKQVFDKARTDGLLATYRSVESRLNDPLPLGYSCAGEVIEVGENVDDFKLGDRVACGGAGYATHSEVNYVPANLCVPLSDDVPSEDAAFVTLGSIALQGIRRLDPSPGETIGVIGLGLIGNLTVGILDAYGYPVVGTDINSDRVERALDYGLTDGLAIGEGDIKSMAGCLGPSEGLDGVIITASTASNDPIELAGQLCRDQGRVSVVGNVGMDIPRDTFYDKELDVRISRSYGPGRYDRTYEEHGIDYPVGHVRWTENRNMAEFVRLLQEGLSVEPLVTHRYTISEAPQAYDAILGPEPSLGVLLEYEAHADLKPTFTFENRTNTYSKSSTNTLDVGLIGAGNFAKNTLLPVIDNSNQLSLYAVASGTGRTAQSVGAKYGAKYCTTRYEDIIEDDLVDLIVIATQHDLHAKITAEALLHDKDVHVEKPPALDREELGKIVSAAQSSDGRLLVGYNRRFAPATVETKAKFANASTPLIISYRVNADQIPADHWIRDPDKGGGRIVGEVCHFVDFEMHLIDSLPERVFATRPNDSKDENVQITINFSDGSVGTILYTTLGDNSVPKEYIEIFGEGSVTTIDNFKSGFLNLKQKKGHAQELNAYANSILGGEPSPMDLREIAFTSMTTFEIRRSLKTRKPMDVSLDDLFS